ncbi:MAG: hypothetical protein HZC22_04965 [Rhodocyclales bacterium]|nr:hypothetical protein [Rhodocyclales bacterium]
MQIMNKSLALGIVIALTGLLLGCASQPISPTPTAENSAPVSPAGEVKASTATSATPKVLIVWGTTLPADIEYEVIGPISVHKRWFGGMGQAYPLLANKARELGGNAVIDARAWLAPAFPAQVAPHGKGIAIRVKDPAKLEKHAAEIGQWE